MASRSLGSLTIDLIAKTGGLEQGLDKADRKTRAAMRTIETSVNRFTATFTRAFTIAGTALVGFSTLAVKRLVDTNEQLYQLSKRAEGLNVSVKFLSGMGEQADDLGIKVQQLAVVFGTLNRQIATAQRGSATAKGLFTDFGVDPDKVKSTEDAFLAIADSVKKYGLDAKRAGELTQIFGASGKDIVPILKQGAAAIREQNDAMAKTHQIITDKDVPAITALYQATDSIGDSFTALRNTLVIELAPAITEWAKQIQDFVATKGPAFAESIKTVISHLKEMAMVLGGLFGAVIIGKTIASIVAFVGALRKLAAAISVVAGAAGGLRVALMGLGAIGVIAALVGAGVLVFQRYQRVVDTTHKTVDEMRKATEGLSKAQGAAVKPARDLAIAARDHAKAALQDAQATLVQLQAQLASAQQTQQVMQQRGMNRPLGGGRADSRMGYLDAQTWVGQASNQLKAQQARVDALKGALADLQKKIDDTDPSLFAGLGANGITPPTKFNPDPTGGAKQATDKLASAYDALAKAAIGYANSLTANDPLQRANEAMAAGVENLAKLKDAYVAAGGSAKIADELFNKGLQGLKDKFTFDLNEPQRQLKQYTDSLNDQLEALKASNAVRLAGMTLGDHEAQQMRDLASAQEEAKKAITDFIAAHQLMNGTLSESDQQALDALKKNWDARIQLTKEAQAAENAIRGDMNAGWQKGIADFIEQTKDKFEQGRQLAEQFTDGFADAFSKFASGAETAKEAFGSFIDDLFAQALKFVANQAIAKFFEYLQSINNNNSVAIGTQAVSSGGGGWGGLISAFAGFFSNGGRAYGGPVAAGGLYEVNERGAPEMLAVGGRQYLMMGPQAGTVQPVQQSRGFGGTTINVAVQPTSTRRTASQVAEAIARKQRIATARNG